LQPFKPQQICGELTVDGESGSGDRACSQWIAVYGGERCLEAALVAAQHLDHGQQIVRERRRLRGLRMRVARHDRRDVSPREPNERRAQLSDQRDHAGNLIAQE